jgi:superoxide dismutase, Cu-Zn family
VYNVVALEKKTGITRPFDRRCRKILQDSREAAYMRIRNILFAPALLSATALLGLAAGASAQTAPTKAHAYIADAQGKRVGVAAISAAKGGGVRIVVTVTGLPMGMHGIHIHTVGKCEGPMFASAGGHLNPTMKMHGMDNPMGPHAGDLMNFTVDAKGKAKVTLTDTSVTLGPGDSSLFHDGGTALVIHAAADDYKTDPAGNSGARIACGVIMP